MTFAVVCITNPFLTVVLGLTGDSEDTLAVTLGEKTNKGVSVNCIFPLPWLFLLLPLLTKFLLLKDVSTSLMLSLKSSYTSPAQYNC